MNALPSALWSTRWRGVNISVFATGLDSPLSLTDAAAVLNPEEKSRAARFHFAADRERWMRSRALLRMMLAARMFEERAAGNESESKPQPDAIGFRCGSHGKPCLSEPGGGGAASLIHFNLSHSGDFVAIATGPNPVGVDIETWKDDLPVADLATHAFHPDESAAIHSSTKPHLLFYRLWTAKEAVMKCTGLGLSLPPASIRICEDPESGLCHAVRLDENASFEVLTHESPGTWILSAARQEGNVSSS